MNRVKLSTIGNKITSNRMDKISSVAILDAGAQYGKVSFNLILFLKKISFVVVVAISCQNRIFNFHKSIFGFNDVFLSLHLDDDDDFR